MNTNQNLLLRFAVKRSGTTKRTLETESPAAYLNKQMNKPTP